jgi:hypothetical protein
MEEHNTVKTLDRYRPSEAQKSDRLAQLYHQPAYVSAVVADASPEQEGEAGVTVYCVVEGAPIVLYFPRKVATALIAQVAQKL